MGCPVAFLISIVSLCRSPSSILRGRLSRNTHKDAQLDYVLSDSGKFYGNAYSTAPLGRSDHAVVFCPALKEYSIKDSESSTKKKNFLSGNRFHHDIADALSLKEVLKVNDVSKAADMFLENLYLMFNEHYPLRTVKLSNKDKSWVKSSMVGIVLTRKLKLSSIFGFVRLSFLISPI